MINKKPTMKKPTPIIIVVIAVLIIGYLLVSSGVFGESNQAVRKCIEDNKNLDVVGIEYSCALMEAARMYDEDKEGAIDLCLKYAPIPKTDPSARMLCNTAIQLEK